MAAAESCIKALDLNAVRGLIVSGDAFINGSVGLAKIRHNFPQAIAVEMEATAIAHVCHNFKVPFVVVRAISDVADQQSHLSFEEFLCGRRQTVHPDGGESGTEPGTWLSRYPSRLPRCCYSPRRGCWPRRGDHPLPANTELAFAAGITPVGVSSYSDYPSQAKTIEQVASWQE